MNTWFDPGKEAEAATALLAQGADILTQHTDSAAPLQEAEKRGRLAFGRSSDQCRIAPKAQLTSIVDDWDGYVIGEAKAVLDGTSSTAPGRATTPGAASRTAWSSSLPSPTCPPT